MASERVAITRRDTGESIEIDALVSAEKTLSWTITDHPVERGAKMSNHRQRQPDSMTLEGVVVGIDIAGTGSTGVARMLEVEDWIRSASSSDTLLDVYIPSRPGISGCMFTLYRASMTPDEKLDVTIALREVVVAVARSTGATIVSSRGGAGGGGNSKTKKDLSSEVQKGEVQPEGGTLYELREAGRAVGRVLGGG